MSGLNKETYLNIKRKGYDLLANFSGEELDLAVQNEMKNISNDEGKIIFRNTVSLPDDDKMEMFFNGKCSPELRRKLETDYNIPTHLLNFKAFEMQRYGDFYKEALEIAKEYTFKNDSTSDKVEKITELLESTKTPFDHLKEEIDKMKNSTYDDLNNKENFLLDQRIETLTMSIEGKKRYIDYLTKEKERLNLLMKEENRSIQEKAASYEELKDISSRLDDYIEKITKKGL